MNPSFHFRMLFFLFVGSLYAQQIDSIPVHDTFQIDSKVVGEVRTIHVWTPPGYGVSTDSLPVVYMPDGGIEEDFPHIANTLDALIAQQRIPPVILVGIANTQRRRDLTGPTDVEQDKSIAPVVGGSEKFRGFIQMELFPEVYGRYRTLPYKAIIGESLAGLFIVETFFLQPELFDAYIAMDPSLWWNDHQLVQTAATHLAQGPYDGKRLWFAGSKAKDIAPYTKELAAILKAANKHMLQWQFSDEPKEKHQTIYRATKEKALIWTLNP